tara:strand:+ start:4737 stop:6047 length:1311 start_codon:yes stop_codon:yes gene_type:complete
MQVIEKVFPITTNINSQGKLEIGGCDIESLAKKYQTPFYVFDTAHIEKVCDEYKNEFNKIYDNTQVVYGSKAFANKSIFKLILDKGLGVDVVSGGELTLAIQCGIDPDNIYFHGNNKTPMELELAQEAGLTKIVVDGFYELELLNSLSKKKNIVQDIIIRLSPAIELDERTHEYTTTGILDSKFGFAIDNGDAERAINMIAEYENLNLIGIHFHLGSPLFSTKPYELGIRKVAEFISHFDNFDLQEFSPGGGFAVSYTRDDSPPDVSDYASVIGNTMNEVITEYNLPKPKLVIEPGRAIAGPAGIAIYTVGAIKNIENVRKFISVDGGMGDNIRPALYGSKYEAIVVNRLWDERPKELVTIVGKYCESGDILVKDIELPEIKSGDLIAIPVSGAYSTSMASNYNMNPRPEIIAVKDGLDVVIRKKETFADLFKMDV